MIQAMETEFGKKNLSEVARVQSAARRVLGESVSVDWARVAMVAKDMRRKAKADRLTPVTRHSLTTPHIRTLAAYLGDDLVFCFLVQCLFMLRVGSLQEVDYRHITVRDTPEGSALDVLVVHEKAPSDLGPRLIRGFPLDVGRISPASAHWSAITHALVARRRAARPDQGVMPREWRGKGGYPRYLARLKHTISDIIHIPFDITTHDARRTGACLHREEGWSLQTLAAVGGWSLTDHTNLIKYLGTSMNVIGIQNGR